jgi:hypothetical protein
LERYLVALSSLFVKPRGFSATPSTNGIRCIAMFLQSNPPSGFRLDTASWMRFADSLLSQSCWRT